MIQFKVSVPGKLSLFGEHTVKHGTTGLMGSIDLRTTLTFKETSNSDIFLHVDYPQNRQTLDVSLKEFRKFYNVCARDIESLYNNVLQYITQYYKSINHKIIVQAFLYLFIYIAYKEQIEIKAFNMQLFTEFLIDNEFACTASITVSLVACFLNWSRLRKGTFNVLNIKKVQSYAKHYEEISSQSGIVDIITCLYGSLTEYQDGFISHILEGIPSMMILLVDSNQKQCLDAQIQQVVELTNTAPEIVKSIFDSINELTKRVCDIFQQLKDIHLDKSLDIETRTSRTFALHIVLEICTHLNQNLLNSLKVSHHYLDNICLIARKYGKYTDIGNGRFAYIWCPQHVDEPCTHMKLLAEELTMQGFHVTETKFSHEGAKIEL